MDDWTIKKLDGVKVGYELLAYWYKNRWEPCGKDLPAAIVLTLSDVPAVVSRACKGREVVTITGLDLWLNGDMKKANVTQDEAVDWLMG